MNKTVNDIIREITEKEQIDVSEYEFILGCGDTITCDDCYNISHNWFSGDSRAICEDCYESKAVKQ